MASMAGGAPGPGPTSRQQPSLASFVQWLMANKKQVVTGASAVAALYLAYRAYHSESASQLAKVQKTLREFAVALSTLSSTSALLMTDLHTFLTSDSDELPRSLRQLNKLLQSHEVQATVARTVTTVGNAVSSMAPAAGSATTSQLLQQVLDAVLSDRGHTLVGVAVERATRNATVAVCEYMERIRQDSLASGSGPASPVGLGQDGVPSTLQAVVSLMASEHGERVLTLLITKSIRTAITSYVDATAGINYYDEMVASIRPPDSREAVTEVMSRVTAVFCRELVAAMRRPARQTSSSSRGPSPTPSHRNFPTTTNTTRVASAAAAAATASQLQLPPSHSSHPAPPLSRASSSTGSVISLAGHTGYGSNSVTDQPTPSLLRRRSSADDALNNLMVTPPMSASASDRVFQLPRAMRSGLAPRPPLPPQHAAAAAAADAAAVSEMLKPATLRAMATTVGTLTHSSLDALVKEPALFKVLTAMISVGAYQAMRGTSEAFFGWLTVARVSAVFAMMGAMAVCVWVLCHASPAAAMRWFVTMASGPSP